MAEDYADMNRDELIRLIIYRRERMEEADFAREESDRRISELTKQDFRTYGTVPQEQRDYICDDSPNVRTAQSAQGKGQEETFAKVENLCPSTIGIRSTGF